MKWLMTQSEIERLEKIEASAPADFNAWKDGRNVEAVAGFRMDGRTAIVPVVGPLLPARSELYDYFGIEHTAYSDIRKGVADSERMGADRIILDINSPGGYVDGLYGTMNAIESAGVPVSARVGGMAASAAYMLASMAGDISAENELSMIGSVGVATSASVNKYSKEIANTDSPKKRPDVSTADGEATIREELDDVYSVIVERIAKGRGTTVDTVNMMYGQGAVMTARKAVQRGMIDKVGFENTGSAPAKTKGMNMETEQKPEAEAVATVDGAAVERERIKGIESLVSEFSSEHPAVVSAVRAEIDALKFNADATVGSVKVALLPVVSKAYAALLADLAGSRADANKAAETTAAAVPDLTGKESAAKESAARAQGLAAEVEGVKK